MNVHPTLAAIAVAASLFLGMLLFLALGRFARRRFGGGGEADRQGLGIIEGAIFALVGLLIAFSFSSAAARFENRRALIVQDANTIGTAYLRLDLLAPTDRDALRAMFKELVDSRVRVTANSTDTALVTTELARTRDLEGRIWTRAVAACQAHESQTVRNLVLPPINDVFDIAAERYALAQAHLPATILVMLLGLLLAGAFLAGHGMAPGRNRVHTLVFAGVLAGAVYVIIDLEHPRVGLITLDEYDRSMIDLQRSMQ